MNRERGLTVVVAVLLAVLNVGIHRISAALGISETSILIAIVIAEVLLMFRMVTNGRRRCSSPKERQEGQS
ncbi:MAG: hypothetical protein WBD87_13570 [Candidatus Acidiferrales bacterium]